MIWQGHSKEELDRCTLRQLGLFVEKANVRLKRLYDPQAGRTGRGSPR